MDPMIMSMDGDEEDEEDVDDEGEHESSVVRVQWTWGGNLNGDDGGGEKVVEKRKVKKVGKKRVIGVEENKKEVGRVIDDGVKIGVVEDKDR